MELSERISKVVSHSGLNASQYSQRIGTKTPQAIRDLMNGKTKSLSADMQSKILSFSKDINPAWLLAGEGEMIISSGAQMKGNLHSPDGIYAEDSEVIVGDGVLKERIKSLQKEVQTLKDEKKSWEKERISLQKDLDDARTKLDDARRRIDELTDKLLEK